jgi:hypothetical protein
LGAVTDRTQDQLADALLAQKGMAAPLMLRPGENRRGFRATTAVIWVSAIGVAMLAAAPYFHLDDGLPAAAPATVDSRGLGVDRLHYTGGFGASPTKSVSSLDAKNADMGAVRPRSVEKRPTSVRAAKAPPSALRAEPSRAPIKKVARPGRDGAKTPGAVAINPRSHRVQLIALSSPVAVQRRWRSLRRRHVDLFGPLRMTMIKATAPRGGTEFYRLQVGPFQTRLAARQLCRKARKRRLDCLVLGP